MKKIILGLGALTAMITPVAFAADCGGKSSKTVLANVEHTGTGTQQTQAVNPLDSKFIVQGNTLDATAYEEYALLQLAKEFGADAFKTDITGLSQELQNKITTRRNELNELLKTKLYEFAKNHINQKVTLILATVEYAFPTTQLGSKESLFNGLWSRISNSIDDLVWDDLIDSNGTNITITKWNDLLLSKLKQNVSPTADWQNLTLEKFVKFYAIKNKFYSALRSNSKFNFAISTNASVVIINNGVSKSFQSSNLISPTAITNTMNEFLHLDAPFPIA